MYLLPSTRFHLMVSQTLPSVITALEGLITKYIKKWLKLPRSATWAIIYHPSVLKIPSLGSVKVRAKLSLLASLSRYTDPAVMDMDKVLNDPAFLRRNHIDQGTQDLFQNADRGQPVKPLRNAIKKLTLEKERTKWNEKLQSLQVLQPWRKKQKSGPGLWMSYLKVSYRSFSKLDLTPYPRQ